MESIAEREIMRRLIHKAIRLYQVVLSPWLGGACRFYPSCSEYMKVSLIQYKWRKALFLGFKRVFKCHPLHPGGVDFP